MDYSNGENAEQFSFRNVGDDSRSNSSFRASYLYS